MQVKRTDEMARKLRFFHDQVQTSFPEPRCAYIYAHVVLHRAAEHPRHIYVHRPQVKKENLVTGSRLSAEQDYGFDELEVRGGSCVHVQVQHTASAELRRQCDEVDLPAACSTHNCCLSRLQVKLDELEKELQELNGNAERLGRSHAELLELQLVLEIASQFFDDAQHSASSAQSDRVDSFGGA